MIKLIQRVFIALFPMILLSACSSGVTSSNAGGAGTNTGNTGLLMFAVLVPDAGPYYAFHDCSPSGIPSQGISVGDGIDDTVVKSNFGTITITVQDPSNIYFSQSQGVTFDSYTVSFQPTSNGPPLSSRTYTQTIVVVLARDAAPVASPATGILLVDADTTKREYERKDSGTTNTYNITVTYRGRDFISGEPVSVTVNANIEIAGCEGIEAPIDPEPEPGVPDLVI